MKAMMQDSKVFVIDNLSIEEIKKQKLKTEIIYSIK